MLTSSVLKRGELELVIRFLTSFSEFSPWKVILEINFTSTDEVFIENMVSLYEFTKFEKLVPFQMLPLTGADDVLVANATKVWQ